MTPRTLYWLHYFLRTRRRSGRTVEACLRDALEALKVVDLIYKESGYDHRP